MQIADTNVVVGMITGLTEAQWEVVRPALVEAEVAENPLLVVEGVLVESEWVLRRRFGMARRDIAAALTDLLDSAAFEAWDPPLAATALRVMAEEPRLDLVDAVLVARDVLGEGAVISLDRLLVRTVAHQHERLGG